MSKQHLINIINTQAFMDMFGTKGKESAEAVIREAERIPQWNPVLARIIKANGALGEQSGRNFLSFYEDSPLKNPECQKRWIELNDALVAAKSLMPMEMLIDNDWLKNKIETDPDLDCEVGMSQTPTEEQPG